MHRHDSLLALHGSERKTLLFLGDFDGEFGSAHDRSGQARGPVFDAIFQHVDDPPPTPVADTRAFVEWAAEHLVHALNLYTAYPDVTVKEIRPWRPPPT